MLIANIANISQTATTTIITLTIAPTDSKSDATISFIATLCEMTLKGLSVRSNLRILMIGRLIEDKHISSIDVNTMNASS
jgi:hypothetical protein